MPGLRKLNALWLVKPSVLSAEHARVGDENLRLHGVVLDVVKSFCYLGIDILGGGDTTNTCSSSKLTKAETRVAQLQGMLRGRHGAIRPPRRIAPEFAPNAQRSGTFGSGEFPF